MGGDKELEWELVGRDDKASVLVFVISVHASYLSVTLIGQVNVLHKTR